MIQDTQTLKDDLKQLIIEECDKEDEISAEEISDEEALVGRGTGLELDSLDLLQVSMAVFSRYGVRIEGQKEGRIAFASINALAEYIETRQDG